MQVHTFLESISRTKQLPQGIVFCFVGREYPLLFFYQLISFLKKNNTAIESINCVDVDTASVKGLLSMVSFAGPTTYYLEQFSALPVKKQQELFEYLHAYTGPHRIILFSEVLPTVEMKVITLPEEMAPRDYFLVRFLLSDILQGKSAFSSELIMRTDQLSLDKACFFAQYELLLGKSTDDFFEQWMIHLAEPSSSLFTLSQYFFAKKNRLFFRQWATMSELYMPPFWATFWADQIWRAYVYCDLMQQKKQIEAKRAQYKLPFSFINRDWAAYKLAELRNAHQFLSTLDFQLKNGFSEIGLEHFYTQFFDDKFR